jgi:hypothetical protein
MAMAEADLMNGVIILATLFIIFGIFLFFDLFRKGTKWGYLAYTMAVIPASALWVIGSEVGFNVLAVYVVLFILWDIVLLRDLLIVFRRDKEYDDILLFLFLAIIVQLIVTAILPADQVMPALKAGTMDPPVLNYFYLPDLHGGVWTNTALMGFKLSATFLVILLLIPMVVDIKNNDEPVPFLVVVILTAIFIIPFLFLSYIWLPNSIGVLTPLFCVILFIILLTMTKGK